MPLPHANGKKKLEFAEKNEKRKEQEKRLAKLEQKDTRPLHERLTCVWQGRSVHAVSGDVTTWDEVKLEFTPFESAVEALLKGAQANGATTKPAPTAAVAAAASSSSSAAAAVAAAAAPSSSTAAAAAVAAAASSSSSTAAAVAAASSSSSSAVENGIPQRGLVKGGGTSCWRRYTIPFSVSGEYDLASRSLHITKQHLHAEYNNAVAYTLTLTANPDGPTAAFTLVSASPDLRLAPLVAAKLPEQLSERESCKACLDAQINCVLLPCAHLCVCAKCAVTLKNVCPICRAPFSQALTVFPT